MMWHQKLPYEKKSDSGFAGYRCKSKGVGASAMSNSDLLREMLYNIFN
jgi:hypothetical protein